MRKVLRLITGSVAVGILLAGATGAAAIHFSSAMASDHSITAQPAAAQASDDSRDSASQNGLDNDVLDDRSSAVGEPEPETADDSRSKTAASDDGAAHATDESSSKTAASVDSAGHVSDDSSHRSAAGTSVTVDDHGKDGGR